jgi:chromosome segregation ATPase
MVGQVRDGGVVPSAPPSSDPCGDLKRRYFENMAAIQRILSENSDLFDKENQALDEYERIKRAIDTITGEADRARKALAWWDKYTARIEDFRGDYSARRSRLLGSTDVVKKQEFDSASNAWRNADELATFHREQMQHLADRLGDLETTRAKLVDNLRLAHIEAIKAHDAMRKVRKEYEHLIAEGKRLNFLLQECENKHGSGER